MGVDETTDQLRTTTAEFSASQRSTMRTSDKRFTRRSMVGPPTDPNSECTGFAWTEDHPGEFPWTLPEIGRQAGVGRSSSFLTLSGDAWTSNDHGDDLQSP
jgi:hypothetical protein